MSADSTGPGQLAFWKQRLADGTVLKAIQSYPNHARDVFGALPIMRGNVLQLGMILGAREILASPTAQLTSDIAGLSDPELRSLLDELPADAQLVAREFLSSENQEQIVRKLAKRIIKDATGIEPP